jgi:MFS family permease
MSKLDGGGIYRSVLTRNVLLLVACQVINISGTVTMVTLGGILGAVLAENQALATLPMSLMIVGTAGATIPASYLMSRVGRRAGFMVGAGFGVCSAMLAAAGIWLGSFELLCVAATTLGAKLGFSAQYRFGAAESVPPAAASLAISMVLVGSLAGAIVGPTLALGARNWIDGAEHAGTFFALAGLYIGEVVFLSRLRFAVPGLRAEASERTGLRSVIRNRVFLIAVLGGVVGQGTMTFIMTATPLSMHVIDGLSLADTALVIQSHVIAMYAPSLVSGFLVMWLGAPRMMATGTVVISLTIVVGLAGHEFLHYWGALSVLGLGWNLLFVGSTTLLIGSLSDAVRFKAQAANEFSVFGVSAVASLSAGAIVHYLGWNTVLLSVLPVLVMMLAAIAMLPRQRVATASV